MKAIIANKFAHSMCFLRKMHATYQSLTFKGFFKGINSQQKVQWTRQQKEQCEMKVGGKTIPILDTPAQEVSVPPLLRWRQELLTFSQIGNARPS